MRDILFRAKVKCENACYKKGQWVTGDYVRLQDGKETNHCIYGKGEVFPETVGQYTGLTDKNGAKIFEGDIIRYADRDEYECYLESLEYPEVYKHRRFEKMWTIDKVVYGIAIEYPAFDLNCHDFECNGLSELLNGDWHFEVIGNVHDNPELLR